MKLSIITVNFNDKEGLLKTIKSVVMQHFDDYEYIIIDGGSQDGSVEVIKENKSYISYWISEPDKGIYNAMNKAIEVAQGEYCIFMNAGDVFCEPQTLSDYFALNCTEDIICGNTITSAKIIKAPNEITFKYLFSHAICHQSAFVRTSLMKKYKYDETYKIVADRKFFLQALIVENCSYKGVDVNVVNYDINGYSSQNPVLSRLEYNKVLEELFPHRILCDYGRNLNGDLYGTSMYDKLFVELRSRQYSKVVYVMTVITMNLLSIFNKSANFIKHFPLKYW